MEKENTFHCSADATRQDGNNGNEDEVICALVLAGGEGKRLQPFIKSLGKGTLPKQYVNAALGKQIGSKPLPTVSAGF